MPLPALNIFAGNPLDRAGDRRNDEAWLAAQESNPEALALVLWEGRPLIEAHADGPRLRWLGMARAMDIALDRRCFLGLWKEAPVFAVELEGPTDPAAGPLAGLKLCPTGGITETRCHVPLRFAASAAFNRLGIGIMTPRGLFERVIVPSFFFPPLRAGRSADLVPPILRPEVLAARPHRGELVRADEVVATSEPE